MEDGASLATSEGTKCSAARSLARALKNPLMYMLTLAITVSEASLYTTLEASASTKDIASFISMTCSIIVFFAVFLFAKKESSTLHKKSYSYAACAIGACSSALAFAAQGGSNESFFSLLSVAGTSTSSTFLLVCIFEALSSMKLDDAKWAIATASATNALISPISVLAPAHVVFLSFASMVPCIALSRTERQTTRPGASAKKQKPATFPADLACGLAILSICFGILQSFLYQNDSSEAITIISTTKMAAAVLFLFVMQHCNNMGYSMLAKIIATASIASFSIFLAMGRPTAAASAIMDTGYSLLEATLYLIIVDKISTTSTNKLRIICAFFLVDSIAYPIGEAMAQAPSEWLGTIAAILTVLLAVAGIWLFSERNINAFLLETPDSPNPEASFENKARAVALGSSLSERETQIMLLFAQGRSAVFIGELIFISANTVRTHIKHIYSKLGVHSRQELINLIEQAK